MPDLSEFLGSGENEGGVPLLPVRELAPRGDRLRGGTLVKRESGRLEAVGGERPEEAGSSSSFRPEAAAGLLGPAPALALPPLGG